MLRSEVEERELTIEENGHILDNFGNEYRDEYGCCLYVEDICTQCGKRYYVNEVKVRYSNEGCCSEYCYYMDYLSS